MTYQHRAEATTPLPRVRYFTPRGTCACHVSDGRVLTTGDVVSENDIAYHENRGRMRQVDLEYATRAFQQAAKDVEAGIEDTVPVAERSGRELATDDEEEVVG